MKPAEKAIKEIVDNGSMKVHKIDNQGRTLVYDGKRDNLQSTGVWVDSRGKITKY